ncbi:hypothetical protein JL722_14149 [Aureococcus anophagefferens]|nr:hypothetical protein JL722_14149 [Aureococcus anophagefferens]
MVGGQAVLGRDEALAHVTSAAFVDAPPLERAAPSEERFRRSPRSRRSDAAAFTRSAFDALFSIFKDAAALKEAKKLANARRYGFDKLAVLATRAGKVFAVGMHRGAAAWSALVPKNAAVSVVKRGDRPELGASVAHRVAVPHGGAPAKAILNENWVIYSYWNHKAKRAELGSLSLHEGMIERFGLSPFKVPEQESTASAWSLPPPVALQRTFALPKPVTALGATATSRGIASKHILKLNAIYATDAKLESTSLVLATGVDVFGCRHMPSGAFDLRQQTCD